jgi:glycosyltransferase involved in cell wall biosynthesis
MNEIKKKLKVVFVCGDKSGPHYHDIFVPTIFFQKYNLLDCESQFALDINQLVTADVVHFQRQYAPESFIVMKQLQEQGKVCVFLCDDNIWELPPGNPARGTYEQADVAYRYQTIMGQADAVTTSTPYLASKCQEFNPKVTIFRNLVDPTIRDFMSPGRDNPKEIRICWTGTPHHHDDAVLMDEACLKIVHKYPQVKFVFMGYWPPSLFSHFPRDRYEYYAFVNVDAWYACFASLDIDIGLVPLTDHPFNWAKTCRKFQEYSIIGAPTVASPVGNYNFLSKDIVTFVKDNLSPDSWFEAISSLIEDREERLRRGEASLKFIMDNHDINRYIFERAQVYYDVYAAVTGTERTIIWDETHREKD